MLAGKERREGGRERRKVTGTKMKEWRKAEELREEGRRKKEVRRNE